MLVRLLSVFSAFPLLRRNNEIRCEADDSKVIIRLDMVETRGNIQHLIIWSLCLFVDVLLICNVCCGTNTLRFYVPRKLIAVANATCCPRKIFIWLRCTRLGGRETIIQVGCQPVSDFSVFEKFSPPVLGKSMDLRLMMIHGLRTSVMSVFEKLSPPVLGKSMDLIGWWWCSMVLGPLLAKRIQSVTWLDAKASDTYYVCMWVCEWVRSILFTY